ncbi:MAG TPA: MEDS domain-containing protein [Candidatus Limnocylindria bacterium]|nr:MEDS domain-containing protein [Candidatus Limnocylindria bacterium]
MTDRDQPLRVPGFDHHLLHFHDNDGRSLVTAVSRFVAEGLRLGEGVVLIARPEHARAITAAVDEAGLDAAAAMGADRLVVVDALQLLAAILIEGHPDATRFRAAIDPALARAQCAARGAGVRVYGEMVGLFWEHDRRDAASELETLWNGRLREGEFTLFCAYPIDVFGPQFSIGAVDVLLCEHTHVVPAQDDAALAEAVDRAMSEVLGRRAEGLRLLIKPNFRPAWAALPRGQATILWVRNNLPEYASEILARARDAYQAARYSNAGASSR